MKLPHTKAVEVDTCTGMQNHLQRVGDDKCAFVRAMVFANTAMASRTNLEREMHSWIQKEGVIPPGNGPEQDLWEVCYTISMQRQLCSMQQDWVCVLHCFDTFMTLWEGCCSIGMQTQLKAL